MDNQELVDKIKTYEDRIFYLETELKKTEKKLKTYTNNTKKYYETHKEAIKQKVKEYTENTNYCKSIGYKPKTDKLNDGYISVNKQNRKPN